MSINPERALMFLTTRNSLAILLMLFATVSAVGGPTDSTRLDIPATNDSEIAFGPDDGPVVVSVLVGVLPGGKVTLAGFALDDESLAGCCAYIRGIGVSKTAIILADGTFATTFHRPVRKEFTVGVTVVDADGNVSDEVFVVIPGL